jgi:hypothetical protein
MLLAEAWVWCVEHNAHIDCRGDTVVIEQPGQDEIHGVSLEDAVELAQALEHGWNLYQKGSINPVERSIEDLSWEERERLNDLERLAYCGYED